jgi:hypothetical protein
MKKTLVQFLIEQQETFAPEYHKVLNPKVWNNDVLKPKIRTALLKITDEFKETLNVSGYKIVDIYLTGSLANYNYTSKSDFDLHLVMDYEKTDGKKCGVDLYDLFTTKKQLWAEQHDIEIYDYPVELYVQSVSEPHTSTGVYSVKNNKWVVKPKYNKTVVKDINTYAVKTKVKEFEKLIDGAINNKVDEYSTLKSIKDRLKNMRQSGLEKSGEYSVENIAFKKLRNSGYIEKLFKYITKVRDEKLSLS